MRELVCDRVSVTFGRGSTHAALVDVSCAFTAGVTAIVGRNGSGKSTLLNVLATILRPSSGSVRFDGNEVRSNVEKYRAMLGFVPQHPGAYQHLSALEFVRYVGSLRGLEPRSSNSRAESLLDRFGLSAVMDRRLQGYSTGMLRRVAIACALVGDPDVLLFDEAAAGLDGEERQSLLRFLREQNDRIVVMATHHIEEVEKSADRVLMLEAGRIVQGNWRESVAGPA